MKKGEKAANEAIAYELRRQAKAIMERALQECRDLGVKVYFEDMPSYQDDGDPGRYTELSDAGSYFDYVADIRKAKAIKKLCENAPNMYD